MSYMHIDNLYKNSEILMFRECYAMEKIHGTSAHISWDGTAVHLSSGGASYFEFEPLFDKAVLEAVFRERFADGHVTVFGEAYGGKMQRMSGTYGKALRFVAFEVHAGKAWLNVPSAEMVCQQLGIEFVHYKRVSTDLAALDAERDAPSVQAVRNGIVGEPKIREGVVLRPLIELTKNNGGRIISKHKRAEFGETKTPREVDPNQAMIYASAEAFAQEWVTPMRLAHVLDAFPDAGIERTGEVIKVMVEDVLREAGSEFPDNRDTLKAISKEAARLFKASLAVRDV